MSDGYESAFRRALTKVGLEPTEPTRTGEAVDPKDDVHPVVLSETTGGVTPLNIWRHPDAHPIVLDLLLLRQFGPTWLTWEPETLERILPEELHTPSVSELNLQKIQACKTLHVTDSFWERWEIFLPCTVALNGEFPDFRNMHVPTVAQCLVSADIAERIRDDVKWSEEMKTFLSVVHQHDGVLMSLPPLDFIRVNTTNLPVNLDEVMQRWSEVRVSKKPPTGSTVEDEQLRRLLLVEDYLEESRARLRHQLKMVLHASTR